MMHLRKLPHWRHRGAQDCAALANNFPQISEKISELVLIGCGAMDTEDMVNTDADDTSIVLLAVLP